MNSDIVHRLGYVVFIHGSGVRLPVSEKFIFIILDNTKYYSFIWKITYLRMNK